MTTRQLLVASIGNTGVYLHTVHSAGHLAIAEYAKAASYPSWRRTSNYGNGLLSWPDEQQAYALWQSPSMMNVSGNPVSKAWFQFQKHVARRYGAEEAALARLVIIHDELEKEPGKIKVKEGGSARGHNGLKSCIQSMPGMVFWRIGVGVGRPLSRDPEDVANFVLQKMSDKLQSQITLVAVPAMQVALEHLARL